MTTGYQERVYASTDATSQALNGQEPSGQSSASASPAARQRRSELAEFLRTRRARITPDDVGLPSGGRRRTPGLRREEVAGLAGVGVTWYTWLEQGRDIRASEQVLEAVARTLRLDRHERAYLFTLAGSAPPTAVQEHAVSAATLRVLDAVDPWPASVQNAKFDVLAYNRGYARLIGDLDALPPMERNSLWLTFTDPDWRRAIVEWESLARRSVSRLRAQWPSHASDPSWQSLVNRLVAASPDFARMWQSHDVSEAVPEFKQILNPEVGLMRFDISTTWLAPRIGARLVVLTPSDEQTRERFALLVRD
jgi:transcriptional regulator with XRE-family HTH domain